MEKSLTEQARELIRTPKTWPHQREETTERVVFAMAEEIERLAGIVRRLCPDKSNDV